VTLQYPLEEGLSVIEEVRSDLRRVRLRDGPVPSLGLFLQK
jgi:hypothetical protein